MTSHTTATSKKTKKSHLPLLSEVCTLAICCSTPSFLPLTSSPSSSNVTSIYLAAFYTKRGCTYITNLYLASDSILGTSQICVHFAHRHSQREWTTRLKRFQGALWVVCLKIIVKAFLDTQFTIFQAPSRNTVAAQSSGPGLSSPEESE